MSSKDIDFGKTFQNTISVSKEGVNFEMGIDPKLAMKILGDCDEEIKFDFWSPNHGVVLNNEFLLMPKML